MKNTFIFLIILTLSAAGLQAQFPGGFRTNRAFVSIEPCPPIHFVKQGASGSGSSWADASGDIQAMMDAAADCGGGEVWVASGTYKPNRRANATGTITPNDRDNAFVMRNNVKLFGGFAGTEAALAERVLNAAQPSILSGDFNGDDNIEGAGQSLLISGNGENAHHVVISAGAVGTAVLDGFKVTGGFANGSGSIVVNFVSVFRTIGGGMANVSSSPTVTNSLFEGNATAFLSLSDGGGGIGNSEGSSLIISNSTFTKNSAFAGGGILNSFSGLTLTDCIFTDNLAREGGGLNNNTSSISSINGCSFTNNAAQFSGGAITNLTSVTSSVSLTVTDCNFTGNFAAGSTGGAGIRNTLNSTAVITGSNFTGNKVTAANGSGGALSNSASFQINGSVFSGNEAVTGGGMINFGSSNAAINGCEFTTNTAQGGGGMYNFDSFPSVSNTVFSGNTASFGGGMFNTSSSSTTARRHAELPTTLYSGDRTPHTAALLTDQEESDILLPDENNNAGSTGLRLAVSGSLAAPAIENCIFIGNTSDNDGGGMRNRNSSPRITNSLFSNNSATNAGGGIANSLGSNPHIINTTFSGNTAGQGGATMNNESGPVITNTIIFGNSSGIEDVLSTPVVTFSLVQGGYPGEGNIDADPLFVNAAGGDYHLQDCSPAINSGSNAAASGLATDLDGEARIKGGNIDMGALENDGLLPVQLSIAFVNPPTTCGATDGTITFSTNLPDGEHTLNFRSGAKDTSALVTVAAQFTLLNALGTGNFSAFSISGDNFCTGKADTTISFGSGPETLFSFLTSVNPGACGLNDGSMLFMTDQPDDVYTLTFKKDGRDTLISVKVNSTIIHVEHLAEGIYSDFSLVTSGSCPGTFTGPLTLTAPPAPGIAVEEVTDISTCGGTDGRITFSTSLPDGSYNIAFKKDGKDTTATVAVSGSVISNGASSGRMSTPKATSARMAVSSPILTIFSLDNLAGGVYSEFSITVDGCTSVLDTTLTLNAPSAPTLAVDTVTDPTTCGTADGSITFATNLPDDSYTLSFKKDTRDTTSTVTVSSGMLVISGLTAGEYTMFTITTGGGSNSRLSVSSGGCVYNFAEKVKLTAPRSMLVFKEKTDPATCGVNDAAIVFTSSLPAGSYMLNYTLDGSPETATVTVSSGDFTLNNLSGGNYADFSIITQACEYVYQDEIVIPNSVAPGGVITPDGPTELCEDDLVSLTAAEGASYLWSTGDTTRTIIVGAAGTYSVTVTSARGCKSEADITVTQKVCNLPPVAVCKPLVVLVANADCYAVLTTRDLDAGSYDPNGDWTRHTLLNSDGIFRPGEYTVTYEVMDPKGAFSTCESQVRVLDHTPPVARARDLILELDTNGQASISVADVDAGSYDNCGPVTISLNRTTFDCSDLGNLQVRLTVTDAGGNMSEALSDIRIVDNTPPVIQATDLTLTLDENGRAAISTDNLITGISDNCGIWSVSVSQNEFNCEHIGENQVVITIEDVQGNRTTATVTVTVKDTTSPVVSAKDLTLYLDKEGKATLTTALADDGSKDNCGIISLSIDREEFGCQDLGEQTLTLTAVDAAGNTSETTFIVTVLDTLAPIVLAKDITLYLDSAGQAALAPEDIDEGSSDNCGIADRSLQYTAFDCPNVGTQPVQYTVTDGSGNSTSVIIQVTVRDTIAPEVLTQNVVLELDGDGKAILSVNDVDAGSSDNCTIAAMSLSQTDFSCADLGSRRVTLTVRDVNGNQSADRASVLIKDPNGVCPCSYGVLAWRGVILRSNEVSAGGVGVINKGKKVRLRNTVINTEGTFVKSPQSRFDNQSAARIYIRGAAPTPEAFRKNSYKDKNKETAGNGESLTLAAGRYGRIKAGKDATLTFSGGEVYIRSLKVKKNASLVFSENTVLLVRNGVKLGKNVTLNTRGEPVRIYAGSGITVGNASEIRGILHTRSNLKVHGGGEITYLEGLFIADKIRGGRNTHWAGGGVLCTGNNEPEPVLASEKDKKSRQIEPVEAPASITDADIRVSVWPNPAVERIQVEIESEAPDGNLLLVDMQGNILFRKAYTGQYSRQEINLGKFPTGTYVLRVSSGGKEKTLRVFKEKR